MTTITITRAQYMEMTTAENQDRLRKGMTPMQYSESQPLEQSAFHRYYSQFVTLAVREAVTHGIGLPAILASTDKHLNDIPLKKWDQLAGYVFHSSASQLIREAGEWLTISHRSMRAKNSRPTAKGRSAGRSQYHRRVRQPQRFNRNAATVLFTTKEPTPWQQPKLMTSESPPEK